MFRLGLETKIQLSSGRVTSGEYGPAQLRDEIGRDRPVGVCRDHRSIAVAKGRSDLGFMHDMLL